MRKALVDNEHLWYENTTRQDAPGSAHQDTRSIWLRGPSHITLDTVFNDLKASDYPAMQVIGNPVFELLSKALVNLQIAELGRVMIVALKPGGAIQQHRDEGSYADHYSRFHLVVSSSDGNTFTCADESVHMKTGELWWFDHQDEHHVRNDSNEERIHIIIDAVTPLFKTRGPTRANGIFRMTYEEAARDAEPMLIEHWDEVAKNKQIMQLKPDHAGYRRIEGNGGLLILGAYRDCKMVGYSFNFIAPHLHYADLIVCNNDILFVDKKHRQSPIGLQLIRKTEATARQCGARLMLWHAKQGTSLDRILQRKYNVQDIIYSREI